MNGKETSIFTLAGFIVFGAIAIKEGSSTDVLIILGAMGFSLCRIWSKNLLAMDC